MRLDRIAFALAAIALIAPTRLSAGDAGYELTPFAVQPGNVFPHGTRPEIGMQLAVRTPGDYVLSWIVRDAEGRVSADSSKDTTASARYVLDMSQRRPGWYSVRFDLKRDGRKLETLEMAFAQLGPHSRVVEPANAADADGAATFSHDPAKGDDLHAVWCALEFAERLAGIGRNPASRGPMKGDLFQDAALPSPRKAYVGVATAAGLLDGASAATRMDCGDGGVHLWSFECGDRRVYAMWTERGSAELLCRLSSKVAMVDFFGRDMKPLRDGGDLISRYVTKKTPVVAIDEKPRYFVAGSDAVVSATAGAQRAPGHSRPKSARLVKRPNDMSQWTLKSGADLVLEGEHRVAGRYELRQRFDTQMGRCLELELADSGVELPESTEEYAVLDLKVPIPISDSPATLGAWVKGNSGMGRFFLVLEDAGGRRCVSCGEPEGADPYDVDCLCVLCNTGWTFFKIPIGKGSSALSGSNGGLGIWKGGPPKPPVKLVGFAFSACRSPIFPGLGRLPCRQNVLVSDICALDFRR